MPGMTLAVHSSLGSIGYVVGGAMAVILALEDVLGEEGTLAMPSHTGDLSDPAEWESPSVPAIWHQLIRDHMPPFLPDLSPTWEMGTIAELFRNQQGTQRSQHPQVSWAARGKHARLITAGHSLDMGQGESSPLGHLYDLAAEVLLLGVDFSVNTSFHLAEYRCKSAHDRVCQIGFPLEFEGKVSWEVYADVFHSDQDFSEIGSAFAAEDDSVHGATIGSAVSQLFSQRRAVDYAVTWMDANRG